MLSHACAVGDVPLEWYEHEEHVGYGRTGDKLLRAKRKGFLDNLLARNDDSQVLAYHPR